MCIGIFFPPLFDIDINLYKQVSSVIESESHLASMLKRNLIIYID